MVEIQSPHHGVLPYIKVKEPVEGSGIALPEKNSPLITDLKNGLVITYVVDKGNQLEFLQQRHLTPETTKDNLHLLSLQNLKELAKKKLAVKPYGAIFAIILDGNFEASILLLEEFWDKGIGHLTPHGAMAAAPSRDVLAFCDSQSIDGVSELRALVDRLKQGDHLLTTGLLKRKDGVWTQYTN